MSKHVAFLRAINVGGHAIVRMTDLKDAFSAAGCKAVGTYIASGNVLFEAPDEKLEAIATKIRARLTKLLGHEPGLILRSARQLDATIRAAPFKDLERRVDLKLYVIFLGDKPKKKRSFPIESEKEAMTLTGMSGRDVFVVSRMKSNRMYGFPNAVVESELGVSATSRNWNTVRKIAELLKKDPA
ncbi:MAG TPA: DUF1697 domain-containing protein [Gemmatimonadaceae bacterium]|nr:DUF1697 domain-containing protein [Gemmatimonadaceae bacterium]